MKKVLALCLCMVMCLVMTACGSTKAALKPIEPSGQEIPDYWIEHVDEKIAQIKETQKLVGKKGFSLGFITDLHMSVNRTDMNQEHSAAILEKVMQECAVPYLINGGDTVAGEWLCTPARIINELTYYHSVFGALQERTLMVMGNHDPTYSQFRAPLYFKQNLTHEQIYENIYAYEAQYPDRVMSEDGTYFYVDAPAQKVRMILLNPYDVPSDEVTEEGYAKYNRFEITGYRQEQLDWFANVALNVPSDDWTVVLCTHTCLTPSDNTRNEDVVFGIIDAFRDGKKYTTQTTHDIAEFNVTADVDYTGRGGEFACWLSGHRHRDIETVHEDTLCITTLSDYNEPNEQKIGYARPSETILEHAMDILTIDTKNHKIYATRIGAGEDREFSYK